MELCKPVTLEIEHCAVFERPEQISYLTFVKSQNPHQIEFHPISGGQFSSYSSYATISLDSFSFFAVVADAVRGSKKFETATWGYESSQPVGFPHQEGPDGIPSVHRTP